MIVFQSVRLALALILFGFGLLAVLKIPHGALWKPAVAATEWGHLLALLALLPLAGLLPSSAVPAPLALTFPGADGSPLALDLYLPGGTGPHPIVVTVHGGSWNSGDRTILPAMNGTLAAGGVAVAAVDYRLAPASPFPAARDDVLAAVRWLEANAASWGLDPHRIVLHGRSAGGHLVLSAAYHTTDPAIRGVIAMYPPTDMHWSWAHPGNARIIDTPGTLRQLLGGSPVEVPAVYDAASPIRFVGPGSVPTLLVHGGRDELVFPEQSRRLDDALASAGVPHLLVELPWGTHGLDANPWGPGGRISTWLTERFLARVLR